MFPLSSVEVAIPAGVNNERASMTTSCPLWRAVVGFAPYEKSGISSSALEKGGRDRRVTHTDFVRMVFQYSKFLEVERKIQSLWAEFF
jgi:hypothetical protein